MTVKNVEKKENNTAAFQVETDAAAFEAAVNGAYLKNKSSIYIPGFRKGKAPRAVVAVSYTHLDVYKRQPGTRLTGGSSLTPLLLPLPSASPG